MRLLQHPRFILGLFGVIAACFLMQASFGQPFPKKDEKETPRGDDFGFAINETAAKKIESVKKHLKAELPADEWKDIIFALQGMLDEEKDSLVEIDVRDPLGKMKREKVSVKREVNRIIGTFSGQGRSFYQAEVGPTAQDKLKQAIEQNDYRTMSLVSERYLHTKSGAEATVLLAKFHLDRGRYQSAADAYRRFADRNPEDPVPVNVLFMAALANKRLANEAAARNDEPAQKLYEASADTYWKRFTKEVGDREVTIQGKKVTVQQLKAEYEKTVILGRSANLSDWFCPGGNYTHTALGKGGRPFLDPLWQFSMLHIQDEDQKKVDGTTFDQIATKVKSSISEQEKYNSSPPLPGFFPVATAGKVIFRAYGGTYCVATRNLPDGTPAGEMAWCVEHDNSLGKLLREGGKRATIDSWIGQYFSQGPKGILYENGVTGTLSHDGTNVYIVDDIAVPPHPNFMNQQVGGFGGVPQQSFGTMQQIVQQNKMLAINIETGKRIWAAGGTQTAKKLPADEAPPETSEYALTEAIFLGPPLPLGGKLYSVIEKERELRLVCIDPTKISPSHQPELLWSQPLGSPNVSLPQDSVRRIQGIHLAFGDNVLVCPTNAGAVLGVDILSHSIVWAKSYRSATAAPQPIQPGMPFRPQQPFNFNQDRWRSAMPIIASGKVVFTAFDSNSILCLNLRDGTELWEVARSADDLYVAGVFDNRVMVVGRTSVRFLDLNDKGKQLGQVIPTGVPSGIGTASKDSTGSDVYFLPLRSAPDSGDPEIWSIDVKRGDILAKTKSRKKIRSGNLVFFDGAMFSQGPLELTCYPQLDVKIEEMKTRLKKDENDPIGLAEMGDLLLDDGKHVSAIDTLNRCLNSPTKPNEMTALRAKEKLYEAITELLGKDFDAGEKYLEQYRTLCEVEIPANADPFRKTQLAEEKLRRKSNFFCLVAKGKEKQGKLVDAYENYIAFGALTGTRDLVPSIDQPGTLTRPDVYVLGRINNMLDKATKEQREPVEKKAQEQWVDIQKKGDLDSIRSFVRVFGTRFGAGNEARLVLADKLISTNNEDDIREAENILLGLKGQDDVSFAARAIEALARLYIRKNLLDDAVGLYAELGKSYSKVMIRDGKTGGDFFNELITDKRFLPYLEPLRQSWANVEWRGEVQQGAYANQPVQSSFTIEPDEAIPYFARHRVVVDMNMQYTGMWGLKVFDRVTGEEKWKSKTLPAPAFYVTNVYPMTNNHKFAQVRGHLLLLNLGHMVYAYDLPAQKEIWSYNLFGKNPAPPNNPQTGWPFTRFDHEPDGVRYFFSDGWTHKGGHFGVIAASYVCLITRDGLVAVDPAKGTTLWTKANIVGRVQLMGDENYVFAFETNPDGVVSSARAIRASDGAEIPVQDSAQVFNQLKKSKTFGRRVLVLDEQPNKRSIRLYDVLTGKDDWKRDIDSNAFLLRSEDRNLSGYVSEKGEVAIFNIQDGKEVFRGKLDANRLATHMDKVTEAVLLADRDRYYIMLNRPFEAQNNFNQQPPVQVGMRAVKVNGHMYCFDRSTGKRLWYTDDQLDNQQIVMEQFQDLPIMIGVHTYAGPRGGVFVQGQRIVALDKQTGKVLIKPRDTQNYAQSFNAIVVDPKNSVIELVQPSMKLRFTAESSSKPSGALPNNGGTSTTSVEVPVAPPIVRPPIQRRVILPEQR